MRLPRAKRLAFAIVTLVSTTCVVTAALLAADVYLHKRAERSAGLNVWGYRGPLVGGKRRGEVRIAMLGGSTASGYGVLWEQSIPVFLERELQARLPLGRATAISVVNLAMNNEGAYAFPFTLRDFAFLDYDVVVLYEGYNDLTGTNRSLFRHNSPLFRLVGYYPILPVVLEEKRLTLLYGDVGAGYKVNNDEPAPAAFRPPATHRAAAAALQAAEVVSGALSRQLDLLAPSKPDADNAPRSGSCPSEWIVYCESTASAVSYVLDRGGRVVVATQPYINGAHKEQQRVLRELLQSRFPDRASISFANMGDVLDLKDPTVTFDGMHLNGGGNARVAHALAPILAEAIAR